MTYVNIYWGVVLALHPFILRVIDRPAGREGKDFFFYFIVCLGVVLFGNSKLPKTESIILGLLMVVGFLNQYNFMDYFSAYQMFFVFISIVFLAHIYGNIEKINLLNIVAISGALGSVFILFEACGVYLYKEYVNLMYSGALVDKKSVITGALINSNLSGAHIALAMPAIFRRKFAYLAPLYMSALYLCDSTMAVGTAVAGLLYFGYTKYFRAQSLPYLGALIAMFALFWFSPRGQFGIDSGRFQAWDLMLQKAIVHFPFGNGMGWFASNFHKKYSVFNMSFVQEHNEFLSAYFMYGLFGIVSGLILLGRAIKGTNRIAAAGLFAFFVNCFGNFPLHVTPLAAIGIIYYALSLKSTEAA